MKTIEITLDTLGQLLTESAAEGLRVGKAGTDADFTAEGIAGHVVFGSGLAPRVDVEPTPNSRLRMSDLERAEADLREARSEALRLREFVTSAIPTLTSLAFVAGPEGSIVHEQVAAVVEAAREALEVRP